ncbi:hypothetical protein [Aquimarina celericrescens]|uniref:Uncharacterized protein n=1 Tax=Aquimarina celericrescens TaxID=1964542 RepID=A0ABW5AZF3_9FLAO|nr:hypothetical protein [Aquimarina celericrescens]
MISKLISILISGLVLAQSFNVGLDDVVQLDELMEHAKYHAQKYGDNFFVFISKHYGELKEDHQKEHQEEKEEHEQLPFQHQGGHASSFLALIDNHQSRDYHNIEEQKRATNTFFYQSPDYNCYLSGIFQPPWQA